MELSKENKVKLKWLLEMTMKQDLQLSGRDAINYARCVDSLVELMNEEKPVDQERINKVKEDLDKAKKKAEEKAEEMKANHCKPEEVQPIDATTVKKLG